MESLVFHLEADKADTNLLDSIKAHFGSRRVSVRVEAEEGNTLTVDTESESAYAYTLPYEKIAQLADALENDEPVDVLAEIEAYRVVR